MNTWFLWLARMYDRIDWRRLVHTLDNADLNYMQRGHVSPAVKLQLSDNFERLVQLIEHFDDIRFVVIDSPGQSINPVFRTSM